MRSGPAADWRAARDALAAARLRERLPRPTIRLKLTLWYAGMFLLAGGLLVGLTYVLVRQGFDPSQREVRQAVAERLGIPRRQLEPGPGTQPAPGLAAGGAVILSRSTFPEVIRQIQDEQMQRQLNSLLAWSLVALGVMAVLSLGLGWLVAGRLLRPVHELTAVARRLSGTTLHERIRLRGPDDELKELADTFDGMLERLERAFTGQREFVANASHELRTPLTILRTEIDVALADPELTRDDLESVADAMRDAIVRSESLIDSLLLLARSDAPIETSPIEVAGLAEEALSARAGDADTRQLSVELELAPVRVAGERMLLNRLLDNLIDNAIRHNVDGGRIAMRVAEVGGWARIVVESGGSPVSAEEADRLFERFYRTDGSRSRRTGGFGLGLPIVRAVAEAHNGSVVAAPVSGGGLAVTVSLPAEKRPE